MRNIVVTEFLTLDGVMEAPNEWSFPYWHDEIAKFKHDELFASDALLLGRKTYEGFAALWPDKKDEQGFAERMNAISKYVVSSTLKKVGWNNSHVIDINIDKEIAALKEQAGKDILVSGSADLVDLLLQENLVDRIQLLVYPIVVGKGKKLFKQGTEVKLHLTTSQQFPSGVQLLVYEPVISSV